MLTTLPLHEIKPVIDAIGASVFVVSIDASGTIESLILNAHLEESSGLVSDGKNALSIKDRLSETITQRFEKEIRECMRSRQEVSFSGRLLLPAGLIWVQVKLKPLFDDDQRVTRVMGTVKDLTPWKKIEALQQQLGRNQNLEREDSDFVARLKPDTSIIHLNGSFASFLGHSKEFLTGHPLTEFLDEESRRFLTECLKGSSLLKPTMELEDRFLAERAQDQTLFWRLRAFFDHKGEPIEYVLMGHGSNQENHVALALRESEYRFRALAEGSQQGICIHRGFKPLFVNQAFAEVFGFNNADEILQLPSLMELFPENQHDLAWDAWERSLKDPEQRIELETNGLNRTGGKVWLEIMGRGIEWMGERSQQFSVLDVSARKLYEDELMSQRNVLEQQASELASLAEDLDSARQLAEEHSKSAAQANQAKSMFLAAMSHELRTPLNAILGFSEIIAQQSFGECNISQYPEYAADIHASGEHLLELINDILDIAKIEAGKMEIRPQPLNLQEVISSCLHLVRVRAHERGVSVSLEVAHSSQMIFVDERAIKQVLFNLLSNAIKFSNTRDTITVRSWLREDNWVIIQIEDTGIGIPADQLDRITMPFEQVNNRYSREAGGTGLGLALVKALIGLHDGMIDIDSVEGEGTVVTLSIPPQSEEYDIPEPDFLPPPTLAS
ncbi:ATP-binding protein [Rhodovibrionaceae bacterium A322]